VGGALFLPIGFYTRLIIGQKMIASSFIVPNASPQPQDVITDAPLIPFTCPWAQDGLRKAMEGLQAASAGVKAYKIGTRNVDVRWPVPAMLRSRQLRFCVVASDPAGNRSVPACAPFLRVR
jgi:hypothetical protein